MSGSLATYVGTIAAFLASLSYIPQVRKAWPRDSTDALSLSLSRHADGPDAGPWPLGRVRPDPGRLGYRAGQCGRRDALRHSYGLQDKGSVRLRPTSQHVHVVSSYLSVRKSFGRFVATECENDGRHDQGPHPRGEIEVREVVMAEPAQIGTRRPDGSGWSLAAAIGLMAAAFLWDRIAPLDRVTHPERDKAFPETGEADRDASPAELATEGGNRGRGRVRPPRSRHGDGRTSSGGSTAT